MRDDLETCKPLPIYPKKRYIIIDLTKYVPQKGNSLENKWIELFKTMPKAKRIPKGVDDVLKDVYECLKISNATSKFIKKVATYMVTKEEILTRLGTARREGPHAHFQRISVYHAHEFGVDAFAERFVVFKERTDLFQIESLHVFNKRHGVGVAHRNAGHRIFRAKHIHGKPFLYYLRPAHIDGDGPDFAFFVKFERQMLDARKRFDIEFVLFAKPVVVDEFAHAADAVAAHPAFAAVGVEHTHLGVGDI